MLQELRAARTALEAVAHGFEPAACSGREAVELMEELGAIHRLTDGVTARVAKRIADTDAHVSHCDRSAAEFCARTIGAVPKAGNPGFTTHIMIDHETLERGEALRGETCEIPGVGPVSAEWVQELLGEAFVTAIIKNGKDITTVAHIGRHIPAELRTAMIARGRECSIEGCHCRDYLELDHCEIDFGKDGPTAFWNLDWLCSVHHRRKTQGWHLGPPDPVTGKRKLTPPGESHRAA